LARTRTTKKLAQRIDLNYFKRPTPLKRLKFWLSVLALALALAWILFHSFAHDPRVYSSGRLSEPHAVLEKECAVCHVKQAGDFSAEASDQACLSCHDGPVHHSNTRKQLACSECHAEHRGRINISAVAAQACAVCHSDLRVADGHSNYAARISDFEDGHPEFAALRPIAGAPPFDPGTIKLNHAIHMKPIRQGPNGPIVQLECGNCHRPTAVQPDLTYSDPAYHAATVSYKENDEVLPVAPGALKPPKPPTGRERMAPVKFANACASCHLLTFDKRFNEGVPHDTPEVVHKFVVNKFTEYIAAHPAELREMQVPQRTLTGRPAPPRLQTLTAPQWIAEHTAVAEQLLWKKTCAQCHAISGVRLQDTTLGRWDAASAQNAQLIVGPAGAPVALSAATLPVIAPAKITQTWLPHSKFDHDAHRGFSCVSCHQKTLSSTESTDILIPGIAVCRTCHAPGPAHAESRCFECHTYHDWSKRREVKPTFTLPALRAGAR
jgi:hypothetical protein